MRASSFLQVVTSPRLGLDMAPNKMQWTIKWWLSLPLTPEVEVCAYCRDKDLGAHHAVTCKFGGDDMQCKIALLNPRLEPCAGLGHERRHTRPADILYQYGPLVMSLQPLMFQYLSDFSICSELGSKCVPLVVDTFGAWEEQQASFLSTSNTTCSTNQFQATVLNCSLSLLLMLMLSWSVQILEPQQWNCYLQFCAWLFV